VRKHGLTIDDLLGAEIVTADGQLLGVDAWPHPDLFFWAIRGGGGNFGVVTRLHYRLQEVDEIVGGMLVLPATPEVIASFVAEAQAALEELSTIANVMVAPPMPFLAAGAHGELVIMAMVVYAGEVDEGERAIAPFRALATPLADMVRPMRYSEIYPPEEGDFHPTAVVRTMFIDAIDRPVAQTIVEHLKASSAQMGVAQIRGYLEKLSPGMSPCGYLPPPGMIPRRCGVRRYVPGGIRTWILAPSPGALSTRSVPPRRVARSRIDFRPRCPEKSPLGSKPAPSSETSRAMPRASHSSFRSALLARACFTVLCRASWAMR